MAFCRHWRQGSGVHSREAPWLLETWGSKNRVHVKPENRKVREYQVHTALCLSLLMCWPKPLPLYVHGIADPILGHFFKVAVSSVRKWRGEERLHRPWFPGDPGLNLVCIFLISRFLFFLNKESLSPYMCVTQMYMFKHEHFITMTVDNMPLPTISHIYPSLTKRITKDFAVFDLIFLGA